MSENITFKSIPVEYFGIEQETEHSSLSNSEMLYNDIISKSEAKTLSLKLINSKIKGDEKLFISRNSLKIHDAYNIIRKNIILSKYPHINENLNGWLVLFDKDYSANWAHPCAYIFIMSKHEYLMFEDSIPPSKKIQMEEISLEV